MADEKMEKHPTNPDEIFIKVTLNQKTGALSVHSNTSNQIMQLGMLSMADTAISKPRESSIVKPGFFGNLLPGKKG